MGCIRGITENSPGGQAMKILLTGAAGQLGQALRQLLEDVTGPNRETAGPPLGC
jgi:hypothetical protein